MNAEVHEPKHKEGLLDTRPLIDASCLSNVRPKCTTILELDPEVETRWVRAALLADVKILAYRIKKRLNSTLPVCISITACPISLKVVCIYP